MRDIPLPEIVVDTLREQQRRQLEQRMALGQGKLPDDALVFPIGFDGSPQAPDAFSAEWRDVVETISKRLGHASPTIMLKIYAHLFRKDDGKAATAINAALAGPRSI